jgi:transposase
VEPVVVDASRLAVTRRHRRAQTARRAVPQRLTRRRRDGAGAPRGWRSVRVPRLEAEERRQRPRAWAPATRDRTRVIHRSTGRRASPGRVRPPSGDCPPPLEALRRGDGAPRPAGRRPRRGQAWEQAQVVAQRLGQWAAERRALRPTAAAASRQHGRPRLTVTGLGTNRAWGFGMEGFGWGACRQGQAVGAGRGLPPTPSARGHTADARGRATAGQDHLRAMALAMAGGGRRFPPARARTPWSQPRVGHGRRRRRRRGMVGRARQRRLALWRLVETGVRPDGAALKAAVRLSPQRWAPGGETGLGGAAREETGCAVRTAREQGRPTTALSRRHQRRLEQVFGGKRPTRLAGGLRRMRRTPSRALSTVAARSDRVVCSPGETASARRDERNRLTSAPT